MGKHLKLGLIVLAVSLSAPSALAMSASECVRTQKSLSATSVQLEKEYAELQKLGEDADAVGVEFAAAKEASSLSDDLALRARNLRAEFDKLRTEVDERNADLMKRSAQFNQRQKSFQAGCKAYFK